MTMNRLHIFFSGIGGSGVSAIAGFMADKGHVVSGSDRAFEKDPNHPACRTLKNKGVTIVPQDGSGIVPSLDLAVFSTAVEPDRPEYIRAKALDVPVMTRPEYLSRIVSEYSTIAVAGTSGKSTVSGMLAYLMSRLGLKPNFIGGGRVKQFRTESNAGNSLTGDSDLLVIEACESDGTIVDYKPADTIILNLELDHHEVAKTAAMFGTLIDNTSRLLIINADDANLSSFFHDRTKHAATFAIDNAAKYRPANLKFHPLGSEFTLGGVTFTLSIPGKYNLSNALACIAFLMEIGVSAKDISKVISDFEGVERRFDIHLDDGTHLVADDYAHNPHKIAALMQAASALRKSICYIFQPHGFGPTRLMKDEYINSFSDGLRDSDHLILLPIFYAGGTASKDISSEDLARGIRKRGRSVEVVKDRNEVIRGLERWDNYIVMGARDETLSAFARSIALLLALE